MAAATVDERPVVTLDDFITGLLAGLAKKHKRVIPLKEAFYAGAVASYSELAAWGVEHNADVQFWVNRDRFHGDSAAVRSGITEAVQRDLVSLDNPTYVRMRIKISPAIADRYLAELPGGANLYDKLTATFLTAYREAS